MKLRLVQFLCPMIAAMLGWQWIERDHALPIPADSVAAEGSSLLVPRKTSSDKLSIAWLLRFDQKLVNADETRLKEWVNTTREWPWAKRSLGSGLVQARLRVLTPIELRETEFNDAVEDQFVAYFLAVFAGDAVSLPELTGKDAAAALQLLASETPWRIFQEHNLLPYRFRQSVIQELGEADPENMLGMVRKFSYHHSLRRSLLGAVMGSWVKKDPEALRAYVETIDPGRERKEVGQIMLTAAAKISPRETLENLDVYSAIGYEEVDPRRNILYQWINDDSEAALAWIDEQADTDRFAHIKLDTIARQDVHAAIAMYNELPAEQQKGEGWLAREWQKQDPNAEGLLDWVRGFEDSKSKNATLTDIAMSMATSEPNKAWDLLQEVMASDNVYSLADVVQKLEEGDPGFSEREGVLDALLAKDPKVLRSEWMSYLAQANPEWVAERFEEHADSEDAVRGVNPVVTNWAASDPSAAAAWVANLETGSLRDSAQMSLLNEWTRVDPDRARNWVQEHLNSGDPGWDEAHRSLANTAAKRSDFSSALELADSLVKGAGRTQSLEGVFREWTAQNPAQAVAAFADFDLDPEMRVQIKKKVFNALPPDTMEK